LGDVDIIEKISILGIRTVTQYFSREILKKWNEVLPTVFLRSKIKIKSPSKSTFLYTFIRINSLYIYESDKI